MKSIQRIFLLAPLFGLFCVGGCSNAQQDSLSYFGKPSHTLSGFNLSNSYAVYSPNGKLLAATGSNSTRVPVSRKGNRGTVEGEVQVVKIWNSSNWNLVHTITLNKTAGFFDADYASIAFSPDSKILAISAAKKLYFYDTSKWKLVHTMTFQVKVSAIDFSRNGKLLVVGYKTGDAKLWSTSSLKLLKSFRTKAWVDSVRISPDNKLLAISTYDGFITLHQTDSLQPSLSIRHDDFDDPVNGVYVEVRFMPAENAFFTTRYYDDKIRLWDNKSGKQIRSMDLSENNDVVSLFSADVLQDEKTLLTVNCVGHDKTHTLGIIWDFETGKKLATYSNMQDTSSAIWSPDGKTIVAVRYGEPLIEIWPVPSLNNHRAGNAESTAAN